MDISVNKPFKDYIHDKFKDFHLKNKNSRPPSKEQLNEIIYDIWNNPNLIAEDIIKKSFKIMAFSIYLTALKMTFFTGLMI